MFRFSGLLEFSLPRRTALSCRNTNSNSTGCVAGSSASDKDVLKPCKRSDVSAVQLFPLLCGKRPQNCEVVSLRQRQTPHAIPTKHRV